ncbi:MAG: hypothetical protein E6K52_01205 [Gammaproteobacteria bacterium]|nr:MAG: hypothetical protein E6K52_01205 [Gammaproteobacteria bacterium]
MRSIMSIIDKLDIRRPQVLVEAIIADVDVTRNAELGVNWAAFAKGGEVPAGAFVSPVGGTSIVDLATAAQNPANVTSTLLDGTTIGIGRIISGSGVNFAATLRAIRGDGHTNVIATPSAVTMDNQEAELKVATEVPFVTGQFTNTTGQSLPDHSAPGSGHHPESDADHLAGRQFGDAQAVDRELEHRPAAAGRGGPGYQQAHRDHQCAHRGRRCRGARRPDLGHQPAPGIARAIPRPHSPHRARLQDAQRQLGQDQPHDLHPAEDPARSGAGGLRDGVEIQLHVGPAAQLRPA